MAKKIYVGNLSFRTDESALSELFAQYGEVDDVAQVVVFFLPEPYLVFQTAPSDKIVGIPTFNLRHLNIIGLEGWRIIYFKKGTA